MVSGKTKDVSWKEVDHTILFQFDFHTWRRSTYPYDDPRLHAPVSRRDPRVDSRLLYHFSLSLSGSRSRSRSRARVYKVYPQSFNQSIDRVHFQFYDHGLWVCVSLSLSLCRCLYITVQLHPAKKNPYPTNQIRGKNDLKLQTSHSTCNKARISPAPLAVESFQGESRGYWLGREKKESHPAYDSDRIKNSV